MKWQRVKTGDKRIVKRFALFPIYINNDVRLLEWCLIKQQAYDVSYYINPWFNISLIDSE